MLYETHEDVASSVDFSDALRNETWAASSMDTRLLASFAKGLLETPRCMETESHGDLRICQYAKWPPRRAMAEGLPGMVA